VNELYKQYDLMPCYIELLESDDLRIVEKTLQSLNDLIEFAERQKGEQRYCPLLYDLYDLGGIKVIEELQFSWS
jgi:hypothetical protein